MNRLMVKGMTHTILTAMVLFVLTPCFALPDDQTKRLKLRANWADINQQTHRGVYRGQIALDQGSSHLRASEAITEVNQKNQLIRAIAKGSKIEQAHFWTHTTIDKPALHAYADVIYYEPARHLITLVGQARIQQGIDSFRAPHIQIDTLHQHVLSKQMKAQGTTIIIHPEKKNDRTSGGKIKKII